MTAVLANTHYLPATWRGMAHTNRVRDKFGQFFQFRAVYLINEILSPITTPFILIFCLRPRALDIVDFFRNFTVSVVGVGDVCSFAQMDLRKHGNPDWQPSHSTTGEIPEVITPVCETNQYTQGEHGKTELSLIHYTLTNPEWKMPPEAKYFLKGLRKHAQADLDAARMGMDNAMEQSLLSVGSISGEYSAIVQSIFHNQRAFQSTLGLSTNLSPTAFRNPFSPTSNLPQDIGHQLPQRSMLANIREDEGPSRPEDEQDTSPYAGNLYGRTTQSVLGTSMGASMRGGLSRHEGPPEGSQDGLLFGLCGNMNIFDVAPSTEIASADMCLGTLYIHELHHRQVQRRGQRLEQSQRQLWQRPHQQQPHPQQSTSMGGIGQTTPFGQSGSESISAMAEKTPLLGGRKS